MRYNINSSKKIKVFLTGGAGLVGKSFLSHPNIDEFVVVAPTRKELNLLDYDSLKRFISIERPDIVVHAAGKVGGISANLKDPLSFFIENLEIGKNVLLAASDLGVKKLINLASSCIYPRDMEVPLQEEMILNGELEPTNEAYAVAKIAILKLCEYISLQSSDSNFKTLVPCNLYGPHDKFDPLNSHLIPAIINKLHNAMTSNTNSVEIWGDGTVRREFMFSYDFADALYNSIINFDTLPSVMNIGIGYDYSINEYYELVSNVVGFSGTFSYDLSKPSGMKRKLVSIKKQLNWGWEAKTSIAEGILITYQWYLKQQKHEL